MIAWQLHVVACMVCVCVCDVRMWCVCVCMWCVCVCMWCVCVYGEKGEMSDFKPLLYPSFFAISIYIRCNGNHDKNNGNNRSRHCLNGNHGNEQWEQ